MASAEIFSYDSIPLTVAIDIKPNAVPNTINLGSNGTVAVAILSTSSFDAATVDPGSVTLASAPVKLRGQATPMASLEDVNGDGLLDLVLHVSTQSMVPEHWRRRSHSGRNHIRRNQNKRRGYNQNRSVTDEVTGGRK